MNLLVTITILPYIVSIIVKLCNILIEKPLMVSTLEDVANLPRPEGVSFDLTSTQRGVISSHLSHATLKVTTILTTLASLVAAILIVLQSKAPEALFWILLIFVVFAILFVSWIYPKKVYYFERPILRCLDRATIVTIVLCFYDVLLALLSLAAVDPSCTP